jgi:hypothetical protein
LKRIGKGIGYHGLFDFGVIRLKVLLKSFGFIIFGISLISFLVERDGAYPLY